MRYREAICSGPLSRGIPLVLTVVLMLGGSHAIAAETCAWTKTGSGADFGTCADSGGRAYCVSCQFAPRVCVRTPC